MLYEVECVGQGEKSLLKGGDVLLLSNGDIIIVRYIGPVHWDNPSDTNIMLFKIIISLSILTKKTPLYFLFSWGGGGEDSEKLFTMPVRCQHEKQNSPLENENISCHFSGFLTNLVKG